MYRLICTGRKSINLQTSSTGHRTTSVRAQKHSYRCRTTFGRNFGPMKSYSTSTISKIIVRVRYNVRARPFSRHQYTMCKIRTCSRGDLTIVPRQPYSWLTGVSRLEWRTRQRALLGLRRIWMPQTPRYPGPVDM